MHNLRLLPYSMASQSAKDLATYLSCLRVYPDGDYIPRMGQKIVNWGCSQTPSWTQRAQLRGVGILNKPAAVKTAANKLAALTELRHAGVRVPDFTIDRYTAQAWLDRGHIVFERHTLTGNSGEGIEIVSSENDPDDPACIRNYLSPAPLYVKYVPKTTEFRVHVFKGEVIDYIEKKKVSRERRPDNFNRYISSVNLGWVFCRTGIMDDPRVRSAATKAVVALGLDFGAVDIAFVDGLPYVLEVNTAPGLCGTTLVQYVNAIKRYMGAAQLTQQQINEILSQTGDVAQPAAAEDALDSGLCETRSATLAISTQSWDDPAVDAPLTSRGYTSGDQAQIDDEVLLRLDKITALKLKALLANIA